MSTEHAFTSAEIDSLKSLLQVERIRKKKHLYSHLLDAMQLEEWANLFAEDAVADWGPLGCWTGRANIYAMVAGSTVDRLPYYAMHMSTNAWIEITSPSTAISCSYLFDMNNDLSPRINPLKMLGIYEENWENQGDDWQIKRQRFQLLWPERAPEQGFLSLISSLISQERQTRS